MFDDVGARNEHDQPCGCSLYTVCVCPDGGEGRTAAPWPADLHGYLTEGGTDCARLLDWLIEHSTDATARQLAAHLSENLEHVDHRETHVALRSLAEIDDLSSGLWRNRK